MKLGVIALLFLIVFVAKVRLERPYPMTTAPSDRVLVGVGEINPAFKQVKDAWPPKAGARLWFHPERTSFGIVLEVDGDRALVEWNVGGSSWIHRHHLRNAWVPDPVLAEGE